MAAVSAVADSAVEVSSSVVPEVSTGATGSSSVVDSIIGAGWGVLDLLYEDGSCLRKLQALKSSEDNKMAANNFFIINF